MNSQQLERKNTEKQMRERGKTTIAPDVLITIARLTTLDISGVSRMGNAPRSANRLFARGVDEGVRLEIKDDSVYVDLYVILDHEVNIRDISRLIQQRVNRSISEMVGMRVGRVNVHIEDIDYPEIPEPE